jgi:hypothetical protein
MSSVSEDDYVYVPIEKAATPINGHVDCLLNMWWAVHPEKGLAFYNPRGRNGKRKTRGWGNPYGAPQCNKSEQVTRKLARPPHEVQQVEIVYLPLDTRDFEH